MSKTSRIYYAFAFLAVVFGIYACEDDGVEPDDANRVLRSRLYVSFEEYGTSDEVPDTTLRLIYPADSSTFEFADSHVSQVQGGGSIYFNPFLKSIFQGSFNNDGEGTDTLISSISVDLQGRLNNGSRRGSRYYSSVRGMTYHAPTNSLWVVNGAGDDAGVYVINQPTQGGRVGDEKQPRKKLRNSDLNMWGAAYASDVLFTSKLSAPMGIYVFENISTMPVQESDSVATLNPARTLQINGVTNLRGLSYDTVKNVLAVADFADGETPGTGRILIFENFSDLSRTSGSITPTRIISGSNTGLTAPVDVALDMRREGIYLYVADRAARKVSRFKYTDDGNVEPDKVIDTSGLRYGRTPVGLALDARDRFSDPNWVYE